MPIVQMLYDVNKYKVQRGSQVSTVMRMRNRSVAVLSTMKFLVVVCIFLLPCLSDCQGKSVLGIRACGYAIIYLLLRVYFFSLQKSRIFGWQMGRMETTWDVWNCW